MKQVSEQIANTIPGNFQANLYREYVNNRSLLPFFIILFIISPALSLLSAMFNFRQKGAKFVMVLFFGALGYSWILNPGMDSHSIAVYGFLRYHVMSFSQFMHEIQLLLSFQGNHSTADDMFLHVLLFLLSRVTESVNILMLIFATIFGLFYVKNAWLVYLEREKGWDIISLLLFIFFISWVGVVGINAPRNYIGGMVFFFGAYSYFRTRNPVYLLFALSSPLFHFMYFIISLPFFAYVFLGDRKYVYLAILTVSLIATTGLSELEPYLTSTEFGENKTRAYTGGSWEEGPPGSFEPNLSFHAEYYRMAGEWSIMIIFFSALFLGGYLKNHHHDRLQNGLAGTSILLLSLSNFATAVPAMSNRSFTYFGLFALAYLVRYFSSENSTNRYLKWIVYICLPAIALFLFTQYSRIGDFVDFRVLISPLFYPFMGEDAVSLKEFIRLLFGV